jgi:hypothetical protein
MFIFCILDYTQSSESQFVLHFISEAHMQSSWLSVAFFLFNANTITRRITFFIRGCNYYLQVKNQASNPIVRRDLKSPTPR